MAGQRLFDQQVDKYHEYRQQHEYLYDDGCEVVPLCKPARFGGPHYRVVQMHAPVGLRVVTGDAIKSGTPPVLPALSDTPSGDRLLGASLTLHAPDTRGGVWSERTFGAEWKYTYAQAGVPPTESTTVPAAEAALGVARGAIYNGNGARRPQRYQTGRPPYPRVTVDGYALAVAGLLAGIPFIGGVLAGLVAALIDATLDRLGRSDAQPNLAAADTQEFGVDYRPNYFSDGIIR